MNERNYNNIDGLRTFGCLAIIAWHVLYNGNFYVGKYCSERLIPSFNYLVYMFMIISGFGMCNGYYHKFKTGKYDLNKYYSRRYQKIVPFFALLIALNCAVDLKTETIYEGIIELTMLFGFLPNNTLNVIGVAWTLGVIFVFYIVFPFVVFLLDNKRRGWVSFVVSLGITYMCQVYFMTGEFVTNSFTMRHSFLFCLPYFLCGGLIYLYRNEISDFLNTHKRLSLICCMGLIIGYLVTPDKIGQIEIIVPKTLLVYSVCVCAALGENTPLLSNRFTNFISSISMEMYLAHMIVFRIVEKLRIPKLLGNSITGYCLTYVVVVILLVLGLVLYRKVVNLVNVKGIKQKQ